MVLIVEIDRGDLGISCSVARRYKATVRVCGKAADKLRINKSDHQVILTNKRCKITVVWI